MNSKKIKESGQALIIIALAIIGIVAIVGLAIDGGAKFSDQRHAQNAADTAAMAAALTRVDTLADAVTDSSISTTPENCSSESMSGASDVCVALVLDGLDRAASNGYDNFTNNTVKIYSPPVSGYYKDDKDYVQVIITSTINTTFSQVIGRKQLTNIVQAVAYAKPGFNLTDGAMIISYDPDPTCPSGPGNGGGSVDVSGSSTLNLNGGGIYLNSSTACGYNAPNCPDINITSGAGINSVAVSPIDNIAQKGLPSCANPPVTENYEAEPIDIPDDIYWPPVPSECSMSGSPSPTPLGVVIVDGKEVEEWLIYPGFYTEFPQYQLLPSAAEVEVGKKSRIYMASGVYCIDPPMNQDLSWSPTSASLLNGSTDPTKNKFQDPSNPSYLNFNPDGVTLYIKAGGGFSINASSPTFLDASSNPNSDYQGYLIILEGTHTSIEDCSITGGATIDINGLIFAPYCDITVNGGSEPTAEINAQLIGWDIKIDGNTTINFNYDPSNQVKIKRKVGLMK